MSDVQIRAPLEGMRVLDFSVWRPMPHATQILADLGAEVLKVEPPGGDPMRAYPQIFASVARGKKSIVLDLRAPTGHDRALELANEADVVCESWRPGVADRLDIAYERVSESNPAVIYCSLSGYGRTSPLRDVPGHDLNFQALGGAVAQRDSARNRPTIPRLPVADLEGGTVCALLICAAWARRLFAGVGERIEVSMADVVAWWVGPHSGGRRQEFTSSPQSPGYGVFQTQDGKWITLAALSEQRLWDAICEALGLEDARGLPFEARYSRAEELNTDIARAIGRLDLDAALRRLEERGAPVSPVLRPEDIAAHPHFQDRGLFAETNAGLAASLPAVLGSGTLAISADLPEVDEHTGFSPRPGDR